MFSLSLSLSLSLSHTHTLSLSLSLSLPLSPLFLREVRAREENTEGRESERARAREEKRKKRSIREEIGSGVHERVFSPPHLFRHLFSRGFSFAMYELTCLWSGSDDSKWVQLRATKGKDRFRRTCLEWFVLCSHTLSLTLFSSLFSLLPLPQDFECRGPGHLCRTL